MAKVLRVLLTISFVIAACIFAARLIYPLPTLDDRPVVERIPASAETELGRKTLSMMNEHPGLSGALPLSSGVDAFAARVLLANAAEQTLDVQYYIWQRDLTGLLLIDALRKAAERGVRVRLLVDDNGTPDLDAELAALNDLPTMEVRLFNPFTLRDPRLVSYLFDFPRLNRRMHNKSFTADGAVTIVGGRNVGDIYFSHGNDGQYFDLDIMAAGQAAADTGEDFDRYWSSASAYPVDLLVPTPQSGLDSLAAGVAQVSADPEAETYDTAVRESQIVQSLIAGTLPLEWVEMTLASDDPAKGIGEAERDQLLISRLAEIFGQVETSIDLISAYFVPGEQFTEFLTRQAQNGVRTRTLTNSQESTDVLSVHSGYVKYRDDLLASGVEVYELKSGVKRRFSDQLGILGSSTTSLHAKTFTIDDDRIFIGSFNFDPRSALLNTEMGFLVHSPTIAQIMTDQFDQTLPLAAYTVSNNQDGTTQWVERGADGKEIRHDSEPYTTWFSRFMVKFMGWLPITWML